MKILNLRFKNLNSLVGEWQIDLTHPAYLANGIFALTGPTGAGKTTVLDALCLALYGSTPRLGRVTKSGNEIMSRQTGDCFAEVTFETPGGRYRCHWSQHRARRRPEGELQAPKHELSNADTGALSQTKLRGVAEEIVSVTGMDFERFSRSMLLAQGGFAAFLQAAPDERSPILEQITGTEIYSQISIRVHERLREEREKRDLLRAEISGIQILEPEQEEAMTQELLALENQEKELQAQAGEATRAIVWLKNMADLKGELLGLGEESVRLQTALEAFGPERARLERALKAAALDGVHANLEALRRQEAEDQATLRKEEAELPGLQNAASTQAQALQAAERCAHLAREEWAAAAPLIRSIRSLDQRMAERARAISESATACSQEAARIEADRGLRTRVMEKRLATQEALQATERYLQEHVQDEGLVGGLAGIEEQFGNLLARQEEILRKESDLQKVGLAVDEAGRKLDLAIQRSSRQQQEVAEASRNLQRGKDALGELLGDRSLREYRAEKETLLRELAYIRRIEELEAYRARLEDGRPCPLCGALEHPFARGHVPAPDLMEQKIEGLTRLIARAEDLESALRKGEEAEKVARNNLHESEKLESAASHERKVAEKSLEDLGRDLSTLRTAFGELKQALAGKLLPLGIPRIPEEKRSSPLGLLRDRLKAWQEAVRQKAEIEKQLAALDSEVGRLEAVMETQAQSLVEKQAHLDRLHGEQREGLEERRTLYGEKNPDEEENRLTRAIADAGDLERKTREQNTLLQEQLTRVQAHVETLKKSLAQRAPERDQAESGFVAELGPAGFSDEEGYLAARLSRDEREALLERARALDEAQTDLRARQKDRETRLATLRDQKVTDKSLDELEPFLLTREETLKTLREHHAALAHRLRENGAARERIASKRSAIEDQSLACRRWENLHELIGSSDGKKYRNFAQGLTFELMVGHANRQLQKMTDRYLLVHDEMRPLELCVIDAYQAGEVRSTKNLSGGESFLVSLALALGLSRMASRNVRVDSLFLDEGFGTLDDDALVTALETLAGLQQEGKLIGVISHVSALKERIRTRIEVRPCPGGRSVLSGPGCQGNG